MLRFACYPPASQRLAAELQGAYVVGADSVPTRAEITCTRNQIVCDTRSQSPVGLSLLWPVQDYGVVQLETTRLPLRDEPYHLHVELARQRLMRISLKREEWGLFDYPGMDDIAAEIDAARDLFIQSLQTIEDPQAAALAADKSLSLAMHASEALARFHATVFLGRRRQSGGFGKAFLGAAAPPHALKASLIRKAAETFDFVRVPVVWRDVQPKEHDQNYGPVDDFVKACAGVKLALRGGPLLSMGVRSVPDWMYIWENDFETILDFAREHVRRTVQRYEKHVNSWVVASGLHGDNVFAFNFEQIVELSRVAATTAKQAAPRTQVVLDITQPFGEYYARNQRTIPPLLYADMLVQSGVSFDAFGLQFLYGIGSDGYHMRDQLQISALIDRLANLGKPLHITALAAPSAPIASGDDGYVGGEWRAPWSEEIQAEWLVQLCELALSKPYVESVCIDSLIDGPGTGVPICGALNEDGSPKLLAKRLGELRQRLMAEGAR